MHLQDERNRGWMKNVHRESSCSAPSQASSFGVKIVHNYGHRCCNIYQGSIFDCIHCTPLLCRKQLLLPVVCLRIQALLPQYTTIHICTVVVIRSVANIQHVFSANGTQKFSRRQNKSPKKKNLFAIKQRNCKLIDSPQLSKRKKLDT